MNQTQVIKSAINAFIVVALSISLIQQLTNSSSSKAPVSVTHSNGTVSMTPQIIQPTGPVIQGIKIYASDKFQPQIKEILVKNNYNIEISSYEFQGNEYYLNLILNWGHIALFYILMNKYKSQTDQSTKKKIMIGGAIAVFAWFFVSGNFKPQRFSIDVQGTKLLDKNEIHEEQILDILSTYEFDLDDKMESQKNNLEMKDAWSGSGEKVIVKQQMIEPEIQF